jgi:hypothetical protein
MQYSDGVISFIDVTSKQEGNYTLTVTLTDSLLLSTSYQLKVSISVIQPQEEEKPNEK